MTITNDLAVFAGSANSNTIFANGGNIGIGTTTPGFKLDVYNTSRLGLGAGQGSPNNTNISANATLVLGGNGANFMSFGQYGSGTFNYAQWIQSSFSNPSTATYNLVLQPLGGSVAIGNTSPIRSLHIYSPSVSSEMVLEMGAGQANKRKWNIVVDGGNSTTPNSLNFRLLDDSGAGVANTGFSINGSTQVFSTNALRAISPASVPTGSVLQVAQTTWAAGAAYTAQSASNIDFTGFSATFTPLYNTSKVLIQLFAGVNGICDLNVYIKRNGTIIENSWFGSSRQDDVNDYPYVGAVLLDSPATTSTITYQIGGRATGCGNYIRFGGSDSGSRIVFMEIAG